MSVHEIFKLSDEIVEVYCEFNPDLATISGIAGCENRWTNYSTPTLTQYNQRLRGLLDKIRLLPASNNHWDRLAVKVATAFLEERLDDFDKGEHYFDLNAIESPVQHFRMVFDLLDISSPQHRSAIFVRLETLDAAIRSYIQRLEEGRSKGLVVAKRQVLAVIQQCRTLTEPSSYFDTFEGPLLETQHSERVATGIAKAKEAFATLANWLEEHYLPSATHIDAVGQERYARSARRFLGSSLDAEETYAWGWSQVHEIEQKMTQVAGMISAGKTTREVIESLKGDPSCSVDTGEALVELVAERQRSALRDLGGAHFDIPEQIRRIDVKIAPPGGVLGAYYIQPNEDFSRPGTIFYSLGDRRPIPIWNEITTAYHEGFPGHHLQVGLQVYFADRLTRLHRLLVCYSGYAEGWALYAEELMNELGYYEKPEYVLGMLTAKLFRAARVVIDIGLHHGFTIPTSEAFHPGETWDFAIASDFLVERVFTTRERAESEVTRYLGWPGQAISYKVGERVIFDLRRELQTRQGASFNLREFHRRTLETGSVGLDLLRTILLDEAA